MSTSPVAQAHEYLALLNTLIPPESVEVQDITGATHRLRANLPAAVERRILSSLEALRLPNMDDLLPSLQAGGTADKLGATINAIARMASDDSVLDVISRCFEIAHPKAMREAEANARADESAADYLPDAGPVRAFHLFSTIDLVSGIVPFGLRASSRTGKVAASLLPSTT